jgi:hypothetical protein
MRRKRTIYFNDARHYYLFIYEPPMRLQDAWGPIDELAGTAVDTFVYGVGRGDGLFYPSEKGLRFGADLEKMEMAPYWRAWENMQSLIDQGLDPLTVLVDRAHDKGLDFFASLRMGDCPGLDEKFSLAGGGRGYVHEEMRDHQFGVLEELATRYPTEGVELDFAATPGGGSYWFEVDDVEEHTPLMTDYIRRISQMVRQRPGQPGQVGARIYPTEELNLKTGLDVRAWLDEGLVDYLVPMTYLYTVLDSNMPIDWLVEIAHNNDASVYAMLQPFYTDEERYRYNIEAASPAMTRAAAANNWARGADGHYTWFMKWPLGDAERNTLSELGDRDVVSEGDKHFFLRRKTDNEQDNDAYLPLPLTQEEAGKRFQLPFYIADDPTNARVQTVTLRLAITDVLAADRLDIRLNGAALDDEVCTRSGILSIEPYMGQWLNYDLQKVRPRQGDNVLEIALLSRPTNISSDLVVESLEVVIRYGMFPIHVEDRSEEQRL